MIVKFPLKQSDQAVIDAYNQTAEDNQITTLVQLFQDQVARQGFHTAVEFEDNRISYETLDQQSNQVASYLISQNVGSGDRVAITAERSIETIVMMIGILKSGAAYVPIDPEYPEERRNYILINSECKILLNTSYMKKKRIFDYPQDPIKEQYCDPSHTAYVMYTSGSTGRPKGVIISHRAVVNTILDMNRKFEVVQSDRLLGVSSMSFDLSVYDIFGAFAAGATLVIVADQRDIRNLYQTLIEKKITIWNSVPAIMNLITDYAAGRTSSLSEERADLRTESVQFTENKAYYWSPSAHWGVEKDILRIGQFNYDQGEYSIFPQFYGLAQKGITQDQLFEYFSWYDRNKLAHFFNQLIHHRVLIPGLMSMTEAGYAQYSVSEKMGLFKRSEAKLQLPVVQDGEIPIKSKPHPNFIEDRRSWREFDGGREIPFRSFLQAISIFKRKEDDRGSYYYASAGGLYPVDVYVYVKENRVENVSEGLYVIDPTKGTLIKLNVSRPVTQGMYQAVNQELFQNSAYSIYFVYNARKSMPKYGANAIWYASIETGMMTNTFVYSSNLVGIGTCSVGEMDHNEIRELLNLGDDQIFMHAVESGLMHDMENKEESLKRAQPADEFRGHMMDEAAASTLRLVLLSGDWIPLPLPTQIRNHFPKASIISLGGATEASIWSIYFPINQTNNDWKSIPYGMPLANQQFYVLNYEMEWCPVGVRGELYIGGVGLSSGYYNDAAKTAEAFIEHPLFGRLYRTGDQGILRSEGYIEFSGRNDHQIKIRGYRIELGEIEHTLMEHSAISNAVILDRVDKNEKKYLCAYYVPREEVEPNTLRKHLEKILPSYMVPSYFIAIDRIPLTPNGKIDRNALPEPHTIMKGLTNSDIPETDIERNLVRIWSEVLEVNEVGVNDNFFEIGGHSLLAIKMQVELEKLFQIERLDIHIKIYEYSTIRLLAGYIEDQL